MIFNFKFIGDFHCRYSKDDHLINSQKHHVNIKFHLLVIHLKLANDKIFILSILREIILPASDSIIEGKKDNTLV